MDKKRIWIYNYSPFSVYRAHLKLFPIFLAMLKEYGLYSVYTKHFKDIRKEFYDEMTNEDCQSCNLSLWNGLKNEWENDFLQEFEVKNSVFITVLRMYTMTCNLIVSHQTIKYNNKFYDLCKDLKNKIIHYEQIYI